MESIANLRFLRFLRFPLPLLSETSFMIHFCFVFEVKNRLKPFSDGGRKNDDFLITFSDDFDDFGVPWGVPGVPSGAPFSRHFRVF